jgi:hypothetical protein
MIGETMKGVLTMNLGAHGKDGLDLVGCMHRLIPNVHGYRRNQTALSYEHRRSVHHSGLAMSWQVYLAQDIPELLFKDSRPKIQHLTVALSDLVHPWRPTCCAGPVKAA